MTQFLGQSGVASPNARPPLLATWTTVNTGSITLSNFPYGVNISGTSSGTSQSISALVTGFSSGQTATAHLITAAEFWDTGASYEYGILVRQSSDGKLVTCSARYECVTTTSSINVVKMSSPTAVSASYSSSTANRAVLHDLWFRVVDTGVNRVFYVSKDPNCFGQAIQSVGRTDFLTADQVGFYVNFKSGSGFDTSCSLVSWQIT